MADISIIKTPNGREYNVKDETSRTDLSELTSSYQLLQDRVVTLESDAVPITNSDIYYMMYTV